MPHSVLVVVGESIYIENEWYLVAFFLITIIVNFVQNFAFYCCFCFYRMIHFIHLY